MRTYVHYCLSPAPFLCNLNRPPAQTGYPVLSLSSIMTSCLFFPEALEVSEAWAEVWAEAWAKGEARAGATTVFAAPLRGDRLRTSFLCISSAFVSCPTPTGRCHVANGI